VVLYFRSVSTKYTNVLCRQIYVPEESEARSIRSYDFYVCYLVRVLHSPTDMRRNMLKTTRSLVRHQRMRLNLFVLNGVVLLSEAVRFVADGQL
jgi:hypothetical protein